VAAAAHCAQQIGDVGGRRAIAEHEPVAARRNLGPERRQGVGHGGNGAVNRDGKSKSSPKRPFLLRRFFAERPTRNFCAGRFF
jgi:hypothetical protein